TQFVPAAAQRARDARPNRSAEPAVEPQPPGELSPPEPGRAPLVTWDEEPSPLARTWPIALCVFLVGATVLAGVVFVVLGRDRQRAADRETQRRQAAAAKQQPTPHPKPHVQPPRPSGPGEEPGSPKKQAAPNESRLEIPKVDAPKLELRKPRLDFEDLGKDRGPVGGPDWGKPPQSAADRVVEPVPDKQLQRLLDELNSGNVDAIAKAAEEIGKYGERAGPVAARALCFRMVNSSNSALRKACDRAMFQVQPEL